MNDLISLATDYEQSDDDECNFDFDNINNDNLTMINQCESIISEEQKEKDSNKISKKTQEDSSTLINILLLI